MELNDPHFWQPVSQEAQYLEEFRQDHQEQVWQAHQEQVWQAHQEQVWQAHQEQSWKAVAREAQDHRDATVARIEPKVPHIPGDRLPLRSIGIPQGLLEPTEIYITELPPEDLLRKLARGTLTATGVTSAYLRRAGLAQKLTNCITELLPERALSRARWLDEYYAEHGKPLGPLHGLPISLKESIGLEGLGLNGGYVAFWSRQSEEDAYVAEILRANGAI
ncbi:hypothetical protein LTS18_005285, partial [Coniosporium uncinatum]